jgi:hypothetical protein
MVRSRYSLKQPNNHLGHFNTNFDFQPPRLWPKLLQ